MISNFIKNVLPLILLIAACTCASFAQELGDNTNFSGKWILTKTDTKSDDPFIDAIIRLSPEICNSELTVEQEALTIKISRMGSCSDKKTSKPTRIWQYSVVYYTDERGERNNSPEGIVVSITKWKNESLLIKQYKIKTKSGQEKIEKEPFQTLELKLRDGGKTLIETFKNSGSDSFQAKKSETKRVYSLPK